MQKIFQCLKWFDPICRFSLLIFSIAQITVASTQTPLFNSYLIGFLLLLVTMDIVWLRFRFERKGNLVRCLVSIALCVLYLANKRADAIQIYYFFLLDEIFNLGRGKTMNLLVFIHFFGFMASGCFSIFITEHRSFSMSWRLIPELLVVYGILLLIFVWIHYFVWEQERLKTLNAKLIEYSFQEREYLLDRERTAISQELHDSLGHSLMAVLMDVRYLKAISEKPQKEKDKQLDEVEALLKECVGNLRGSVSSLRKLDNDIDLEGELERIIQKFNEMGLLQICFDYDRTIDKAPAAIRTVLFKTIREGITNSIRHGRASRIDISMQREIGHISLTLHDNGLGCADIQKSFGLNGIIERIEKVNGEVWFLSAKNKGFTIKAQLPGGMES